MLHGLFLGNVLYRPIDTVGRQNEAIRTNGVMIAREEPKKTILETLNKYLSAPDLVNDIALHKAHWGNRSV